jgi:hypothetical protein
MEAVISLEGQIQMVKPTSTKKSVVSTLHHKIRQKYKRTSIHRIIKRKNRIMHKDNSCEVNGRCKEQQFHSAAPQALRGVQRALHHEHAAATPHCTAPAVPLQTRLLRTKKSIDQKARPFKKKNGGAPPPVSPRREEAAPSASDHQLPDQRRWRCACPRSSTMPRSMRV